jgi:hypothetical protein
MPSGIYNHKKLMREYRTCECGCGNQFQVICTSKRRFYGYHSMKGRVVWNKNKTGLQKAWNKGLSKESDNRLVKLSKSVQKTVKRKIKNDEIYLNTIVANLMKHRDWKTIHKKNQMRPNATEKRLGMLVDTILPKEYKYVGDGEVIMGGKCPDFININGQKKIIELFGNYWHRRNDEEKRVNHFKRYGYCTLVIWENELKDVTVLKNRVLTFNNKQEV